MDINKNPVYDEDYVTLGYLKEYIGEDNDEESETYSKNFGSQPIPPYHLNDTWTDTNGSLYVCTTERLIGDYDASDWTLIIDKTPYDELVNEYGDIIVDGLAAQVYDHKIESFVSNTDPSVNWITYVDKEQHVYDYWLDGTQAKVYVRNNTNPITYSWKNTTVSENTWNRNTGHKNIFNVKPTTYDAHDLWLIDETTSSEDIPTGAQVGDWVVTSVGNTEYNKSDWSVNVIDLTFLISEPKVYSRMEIDRRTDVLEDSVNVKLQQTENSILAEVSSTYATQETVTSLDSELGELEDVTTTTVNRVGALELSDVQLTSEIQQITTTEGTASGTSIAIPSARQEPLKSLQLQGDIYQQTYSGKNLFDIASFVDKTNDYRPNSLQRLVIKETTSNSIKFAYNGGNYSQAFLQINGLDGTKTYAYSWKVRNNTTSYTPTISKDNTNSDSTKLVLLISGGNGGTVVSSSNTFEMYDIQVELGSTATPYEPYVGGQPSPNPDYPQPIETVTGRQDVNIVGKNLFNNNTATTTVNGVTCTNNGDGTYTLNGQATSGISIDFFPITTIPSGTYKVVGCPAGGSNNTYYLATRFDGVWGNRDTGNGATITFTTFGKLSLSIAQGVRFTNAILKPMITTDLTATYNDFEPYLSNTYEINLGKNLLNYNVSSDTVNGITYTINSDKTISVKGTASANSGFNIFANNFNLPKGTYTLSGCPAGGGDGTYYLATNLTGSTIKDTGNGITFTLTSGNTNRSIWLYVLSGQSVDLVFKPMLEEGSSKSSYAPYKTPIELCKIGNYRDSIKKATGKNLFDKETIGIEMGGYSGSTGAKYNSTTRIRNTNPFTLEAGTYTLSCSNATLVSINKVGGGAEQFANADELTFTLLQSQSCLITIETTDLLNAKIQLEKGSQATSYEPYGTNWYIEKKIGKVVLDGSENWNIDSTNSRFYSNSIITDYDISNRTSAKNNYYTYNGTPYFALSGSGNILFLGYPSSDVNTVDLFKTWLSTHNTEVYYVLATPTYEIITDTELIGELEDIELLEGVNNIDVDSENLPAILDIDYYTLTPLGNTYPTTSTTDRLSTRIKQTATSIDLSATDNGTSCGLTIKLRNEDGTELSTEQANITLSGKVSFTDLSTSNPTTTIINGDNITTGTLKSSNYIANTSGTKIDLSDGSIDSKNFKVDATGNITVTNATLTGGEIKSSNYVADTTGTKINLSDGTIDSKNFKLDATGQVTATNVTLTGGEIKSSNYVSGTSGTKINLIDGTIDTKNFKVDATGNITATGGSISGSLVSSGINAGNITTGTINIHNANNTCYLKMGFTTSHPEASGLNITGNGGIALNGHGISGCTSLGVNTIGTYNSGVVHVNTALYADSSLYYMGYDGNYHQVAGLYTWYQSGASDYIDVRDADGTTKLRLSFVAGLYTGYERI